MMRIRASCQACGREREAPPEMLAKNPRCMYCGGGLDMSEADRETLESARAGAGKKTNVRKSRAECPVCGRALLVPPGEEAHCTYCACPFVLVEEGMPVMPGPRDTEFAPEVSPEAEQMRQKLLERMRAAASVTGARLARPVELALLALSWRYAHANASEQEVETLVEMLRAAEQGLNGTLPQGVSPLSPPDTADVIAQSICSDIRTNIVNLSNGGALVRVTTETHRVNDDAAADIAVGAVIGGVVGGLVGAAASQDNGYEVRHDLCVEMRRIEGGCVLEFYAEWSTGEPRDMTRVQENLTNTILRTLPDHTVRAVLIKTVFGGWLRAISTLSLQKQQLANRLDCLGPGLEGLMPLAQG